MRNLIENYERNIKGYNFYLKIFEERGNYFGEAEYADECINISPIIKTPDSYPRKEEAEKKLIIEIESLDLIKLGILGTTHPQYDKTGNIQSYYSICYHCGKEIKSNDHFLIKD